MNFIEHFLNLTIFISCMYFPKLKWNIVLLQMEEEAFGYYCCFFMKLISSQGRRILLLSLRRRKADRGLQAALVLDACWPPWDVGPGTWTLVWQAICAPGLELGLMLVVLTLASEKLPASEPGVLTEVSLRLTFKDPTYCTHCLCFIAFTSGLETQYLRINITVQHCCSTFKNSSLLCFVSELMSNLKKKKKSPAGP